MNKKYNLNEFVEVSNKKLKEQNDGYVDSRFNESVTVRRVRDYLSKGLISKPEKQGRNLYFDDSHVEELIGIRNLHKTGMSDRLLSTFSQSQSLNDSKERKSILDTISEIEGVKKDTEKLNQSLVTLRGTRRFPKYESIEKEVYSIGNDLEFSISKNINKENIDIANVLESISEILKSKKEEKW